MAKNTARKPAPSKLAAAVAQTQTNRIPLDWADESARMMAAAKNSPGSKGNVLGKLAEFIVSPAPAADLLRAAGETPEPGESTPSGALLFIRSSRNTLSKLRPLAEKLAAGQPYCSHEALTKKQVADASVPVALAPLLKCDPGTSVRQKAVIADALGRYDGGGNAQMSAALDALAVFGIVRKQDKSRNAPYVLADRERALSLIPTEGSREA